METNGDFTTADSEDAQILACCKLLNRFYVLIMGAGQFFNDDQKTELRNLSQTFAGIYARLSAAAFARGVRMWKLQPKLHLFQHLAEYMAMYQGNPRYYWTYQDEDLVGNMIEFARGVHVSTLAIFGPFQVDASLFSLRFFVRILLGRQSGLYLFLY